MSVMPARSCRTPRGAAAVEVELYRCTIARAPRSASKVRAISSSRACVSTWMVTSSGIRLLLDQLAHEVEVGLRGRREADLDLLEADLHQLLEHARLRAASIGSISAWLPSRRSTLHQCGAA
jgi:hypothetical protein